MSYIYLIKSEHPDMDVYKIGYSKHPEKRIDKLKTGNPYPLSLVAKFKTKHNRLVETTLHNNYGHQKLNGEWFELDFDQVHNFINRCQELEDTFDMLKKANNPFLR